MFDDNAIKEYSEWKNANKENFTWWNFVNMKADLPTALGFAKFFNPDIIELDDCFFFKDNFSKIGYREWKNECADDLTSLEKMMNLYQLRDFFHIKKDFEDDETELLKILGEVLHYFWSLKFKQQYPEKKFNVSVFEEDQELFITAYLVRS